MIDRADWFNHHGPNAHIRCVRLVPRLRIPNPNPLLIQLQSLEK
jgi:hypothetical protein